MSTDLKTSRISIIIPALNEAPSLAKLLFGLRKVPGIEFIVVDGQSSDNTVDLARSLGAVVLSVPPSRAGQMNAGAEKAGGDILLFLHCDTLLPEGFVEAVRAALEKPGIAAGAFRLSIDGEGIALRFIERLVNFRSRVLQMPYGDQGIFLTREMFHAAGAFPLQPFMEDFELVRRLKRLGRVRILPISATTSARRWKRLGVLRVTLINQLIIIAYLMGANPAKLAQWYRRK